MMYEAGENHLVLNEEDENIIICIICRNVPAKPVLHRGCNRNYCGVCAAENCKISSCRFE